MNNVFVTVTSDTIINKLVNRGINLVYPLFSFCVGIDKTFKIEDIKTDGYLFINRVLDTNSMDELSKVLNNLPSNILGIIFDDIGIVNLIKDKPIRKILYNTHFSTNYLSINEYFKYVDDVFVSFDITEEEIDTIISKINNKVSALVFGLIPSFYSRRSLLTFHSIHHNIKYENKLIVENSNKKFLAYENEYGTVLYHLPYYNGLRLLNKNINIKFYNPLFLSDEDVLKVLDGNLDGIDTDYGFLDTKTIYKIKEVK